MADRRVPKVSHGRARLWAEMKDVYFVLKSLGQGTKEKLL